jgi:glycosyltransferase involved in cell wall biosynthesis
MRIAYDMTPYMVNPDSGISRVCRETALRAASSPGITPSWFTLASSEEAEFPYPVRRPPLRKGSGPVCDIGHWMNHRMIPVETRRVVYTLHDLWSLDSNPYQEPEFQETMGKRLRHDLPRADLIATVSQTTLRLLLESGLAPPEKCRCTLLGGNRIEPNNEVDDPRVEKTIQGTYALFVGCLEARKNVLHVLDALVQMPDMCLVLVGTPGPNYEEIGRAISHFPSERLRRFDFVSRSDLGHLYRHAVATLLPSWEEGFGMPILEAMSLACPVITSDCSACAEVGEYGAILVPPDDPEATTRALSRLHGDASYRSEWRDKAVKRVDDFSWDAYFREVQSCYHEVLRG